MDAIIAIGSNKVNDDWVLKPDQHADLLPSEAVPLVRILRGSKVNSIIHKYNDADQVAISTQKKYKKFSKYGVLSAAGAALIGAILLFFKTADASSQIYDVINKYETYLLVMEAVAIAFIALFSYLLKHKNYFDTWMKQRANAETARVELFEYICSIDEEEQKEGEINLLHLQLEYFRRYQLEVQLHYYKGRGRRHEIASNKIVTWGGILTFIIVVAGALSGIFNDIEVVSAFALLGVATPVIFSAHNNLSLISQDERNSKRYSNTYNHLLALSGELDDIRNKVLNGEKQPLIDYINLVNNEISVEHREWISLQHKSDKPNIEVEG